MSKYLKFKAKDGLAPPSGAAGGAGGGFAGAMGMASGLTTGLRAKPKAKFAYETDEMAADRLKNGAMGNTILDTAAKVDPTGVSAGLKVASDIAGNFQTKDMKEKGYNTKVNAQDAIAGNFNIGARIGSTMNSTQNLAGKNEQNGQGGAWNAANMLSFGMVESIDNSDDKYKEGLFNKKEALAKTTAEVNRNKGMGADYAEQKEQMMLDRGITQAKEGVKANEEEMCPDGYVYSPLSKRCVPINDNDTQQSNNNDIRKPIAYEAAQLLDPTGILSYPDALDAYNTAGLMSRKFMGAAIGALPLVGKIKALGSAKHLWDSYNAGHKGMTALTAIRRGEDIKHKVNVAGSIYDFQREAPKQEAPSPINPNKEKLNKELIQRSDRAEYPIHKQEDGGKIDMKYTGRYGMKRIEHGYSHDNKDKLVMDIDGKTHKAKHHGDGGTELMMGDEIVLAEKDEYTIHNKKGDTIAIFNKGQHKKYMDCGGTEDCIDSVMNDLPDVNEAETTKAARGTRVEVTDPSEIIKPQGVATEQMQAGGKLKADKGLGINPWSKSRRQASFNKYAQGKITPAGAMLRGVNPNNTNKWTQKETTDYGATFNNNAYNKNFSPANSTTQNMRGFFQKPDIVLGERPKNLIPQANIREIPNTAGIEGRQYGTDVNKRNAEIASGDWELEEQKNYGKLLNPPKDYVLPFVPQDNLPSQTYEGNATEWEKLTPEDKSKYANAYTKDPTTGEYVFSAGGNSGYKPSTRKDNLPSGKPNELPYREIDIDRALPSYSGKSPNVPTAEGIVGNKANPNNPDGTAKTPEQIAAAETTRKAAAAVEQAKLDKAKLDPNNYTDQRSKQDTSHFNPHKGQQVLALGNILAGFLNKDRNKAVYEAFDPNIQAIQSRYEHRSQFGDAQGLQQAKNNAMRAANAQRGNTGNMSTNMAVNQGIGQNLNEANQAAYNQNNAIKSQNIQQQAAFAPQHHENIIGRIFKGDQVQHKLDMDMAAQKAGALSKNTELLATSHDLNSKENYEYRRNASDNDNEMRKFKISQMMNSKDPEVVKQGEALLNGFQPSYAHPDNRKINITKPVNSNWWNRWKK